MRSAMVGNDAGPGWLRAKWARIRSPASASSAVAGDGPAASAAGGSDKAAAKAASGAAGSAGSCDDGTGGAGGGAFRKMLIPGGLEQRPV